MNTGTYEGKQLDNLLGIIHFMEQVSGRLYGIDTEEEILSTINRMFTESGKFTSVILKVDDKVSALQVVAASIPAKKIKAAERMANFRMDTLSIELKQSSILSRVVYNEETVHFSVQDLVEEILPKLLVTLIWKVGGFKERWGIVTPLKRHGKVIGAFSVSCPELVEEFLPTVKNFAQHISQALELASERKEREQVELALEGSARRYKNLFEQSNDAVFIHDLEGRLIDVNHSAVTLLGFSLDELMNIPILDLHPEEQREISRQAFETTIKQGLVRFDSKFRCADGTIIDVEISSRIVDREKGIVQGIVRDISKRKKIENDLKREKERYQTLFNASNDMIFLHELSEEGPGRIREVNDSACTKLGYSRSELLSHSLSDICMRTPAQSKRNVQNVISKKPAIFESSLQLKDGTCIPVEVNAHIVEIQGEKIVLAIVRDITERKQAEEERNILKEQLHQGEKLRAVGELAGGIAHDFNNMLGAIAGYAELIEESNRDAQGKVKDGELEKRISIVSQASSRAADLVAKLLAFSRRGKLRNMPVNVHEIVQEVIVLLERGIDRKIDIQKEFSAKRTIIKGDSSKIQNAILNIAMNACDAMKHGGILTIHTSNKKLRDGQFHQEIKAGEYIVVSVEDTGTGINQKVLPRIFEPFFTTKDVGEGTGLGLSSALGTMQSHGGYITVKSTRGVGSLFTVYLPLAEQHALIKSGKEKGKVTKGSGTILVIDDEEMIRDMAKEILIQSGYTVHTFGDSIEAISWYERNYRMIDLVLLDMIMPNMDGLDCFDKMRAINADVKVVLASGYSRNMKVKKMLAMGVLEFLEKPFDSAVINEVISRALRNGRTRKDEKKKRKKQQLAQC